MFAREELMLLARRQSEALVEIILVLQERLAQLELRVVAVKMPANPKQMTERQRARKVI